MQKAAVAAPTGGLGTRAAVCVRLEGEADVDGFKRAARALRAAGTAPDQVVWQVRGSGHEGLFDDAPAPGEQTTASNPASVRIEPPSLAPAHIEPPSSALPHIEPPASALLYIEPPSSVLPHIEPPSSAPAPPATPALAPTVPRAFLQMANAAALHRDPSRFDLLYRLLWRLQTEPALRHDPLDPQWLRAAQMAHAVRLDQHKMKAYVRFRPIDRGSNRAPLHVAWFEPTHHIVESMAGFFIERFAQLQWSILTPLASLAWDGERLTVGPGADRSAAPAADAGESLWLTYYAHIFNPARLNLQVMAREMPRRYWKNLPEAALIDPLAAGALERSHRMVERGPTEPGRFADAARAPRAAGLVPAALDGPVDARVDGNDSSGALFDGAALGNDPPQRQAALESTRRDAAGCNRCPLYRGATQTVFGEGPIDAALLFVGEQPGDQEDLHGRPFVGPSGALFDRALAQAGVERDRVYVTNAVKHFKYELRGKRRIHKTASQQEAAACIDWLEREIALVRPDAAVALGGTAARALLGRPVAVMSERGRWHARGDGLRVFITLHPAALLRLPAADQPAALERWLGDIATAAREGIVRAAR